MERNNDAAAVGGTVAGLGALAIVLIVAAVVAGIIVALLAAGGIGIFAVKQTLFQVESSVTLEGMEMVSVFICLVFKPLSLPPIAIIYLDRARSLFPDLAASISNVRLLLIKTRLNYLRSITATRIATRIALIALRGIGVLGVSHIGRGLVV